jgi:hypothetical protein
MTMHDNELRNQTKTALPNLLLTASGPGELTGWVRPLVEEIRRQEKPWRVSLVLWKTAFSTGSEQSVQSLLPGLDAVLMLRSNLKTLMSDQALSRLSQPGRPSALLHLGGEALFSRLLAMRLRCPAFVYSEHNASWRTWGFRKVFLSETASAGAGQVPSGPCDRCQTVGDLFVDALAAGSPGTELHEGGSKGRNVTIGLFPGSRPYQVQYMGPLFLVLAKRIAKNVPGAEFLFAKSEYLSWHAFTRLVSGRKDSLLTGCDTLQLGKHNPSNPEKGYQHIIPVLSSQEVFARSDMVVMLPGTCTAEGMIMGVPMVVLAPYYRLGSNPSPGVPAGIDAILGLLGKCIKQKILLTVLRRFIFFSHPNLKAGREIVPELRGWIRPSQIVQLVVEMAQNERWRSRISNDLKRLSGPPGAAKRIIEALVPFME